MFVLHFLHTNNLPMDAQPTTPSLLQENVSSTPTAPAADVQRKPTVADVAQLSKLFELGVVSKIELRRLILQVCPPDSPVPVTVPAGVGTPVRKAAVDLFPDVDPVPIEKPDVDPVQPKAAAASAANNSEAAKEMPHQKRKRNVLRWSPKTKMLRKIAKGPTRRRFFQQCLKLDSILWRKFGGRKKAEIDQMLFARACKDPMDVLYAAHPGLLHNVHRGKLQDVIKWQVCFVFVCLFTFLFVCLLFFSVH